MKSCRARREEKLSNRKKSASRDDFRQRQTSYNLAPSHHSDRIRPFYTFILALPHRVGLIASDHPHNPPRGCQEARCWITRHLTGVGGRRNVSMEGSQLTGGPRVMAGDLFGSQPCAYVRIWRRTASGTGSSPARWAGDVGSSKSAGRLASHRETASRVDSGLVEELASVVYIVVGLRTDPTTTYISAAGSSSGEDNLPWSSLSSLSAS